MSNRMIALVVACAALAVALLLMQANTVSKGVVGDDVTPATAPGSEPVPFAPRAAP